MRNSTCLSFGSKAMLSSRTLQRAKKMFPHQHTQFEPMVQRLVDHIFLVVFTKFWPFHRKSNSRNRYSSDQATFFQSCRSTLLHFLLCHLDWSSAAAGLTCSEFTDALVQTLVLPSGYFNYVRCFVSSNQSALRHQTAAHWIIPSFWIVFSVKPKNATETVKPICVCYKVTTILCGCSV